MSNFVYKFCLVFLLSLFAVAPNTSSVFAQDSAILEMLKQRDKEIKTLIGDKQEFSDSQKEELQNLINGVIDFEQMGKDALGKEWDTITPEQQAEFVKVFSEIVKGRSLSDLEIYRLQVEYEQVEVEGTEARVQTSTVYKEQPMLVEYDMGYRGDEWRVDDIILDGVSTTEGYARSFQTYIRKRGFDALMQNLNKRLEKMKAAE